MKQKNFSKVLAEENVHTPLWTTLGGYAAKLLPKRSLIALLSAAFLFPASMAAEEAIMPADAKIPAEAVFTIGSYPTFPKNANGAHFSVTVDSLVNRGGSFTLPSVKWTMSNTWGQGQQLMPGDVYQASIIVKADAGYVFALTSPFDQLLPAATPVTNWGTAAQAVKVELLKSTTTEQVLRIVYQVPKTITEKSIDINRTGMGSLADSLKVGVVPTNVGNLQSAATNPQWKGTLTWTPAPARFTADSVRYKVSVDIKAEGGYTFIEAGTLQWSSAILAGTLTSPRVVPTAATLAQAVDGKLPATLSGNVTFKAFSQYPAKEVAASMKVSAGGAQNQVTIPLLKGWANLTNRSWDKAGLNSRFLPDSVYTLSFKVTATSTGNAWETNPNYGFFGLPADHYTAGAHVASVTHGPKLTWSPAVGFNTEDVIKVTFPKTEANPGAGKVIIEQPSAGKGNTYAVGDTLSTTIPGAPKAVFLGWKIDDISSPGTQIPAVVVGSGDTIFKADTEYTVLVKLLPDTATHTFFADHLNQNWTEKYTINDSTAVYDSNTGTNDREALYFAKFKTEQLVQTPSFLAVPHPIAGLKASERGELLEFPNSATDLSDELSNYSVQWYKNGQLLADDDVFAPLTEYTAKVALTPKAGYTFYGVPANDISFAAPLNELNPTFGYPTELYNPSTGTGIASSASYAANSDTLTVNFYKTARIIDIDVIEGLVAPAAGDAVQTSYLRADGDYYTAADVEWSTEDGTPVALGDTFQTATVYVAKLTVEAHTANYWTFAGYDKTFKPDADSTSYTLVSKEDAVITDSTNYAVYTYKFAKTAQLIDIKDIVLSGTNFVYPSTGGAYGYPIPAVGDTIVTNEQYKAVVDRWEIAGEGTQGALTTFTANKPYLLTLRILPNEGWTVFGLDKQIPDLNPDNGTWATYSAGGAQVESVTTWANTIDQNFADVQILFKNPLRIIRTLQGFPTAVEKATPAKVADFPTNQFTVSNVVLEGTVSTEGKYVNDEVYVYTITLEPKAGFTAVGLDANSVRTTVAADSVKHAVNDLSTVKIYFHTSGKRVSDYEIDIAVPSAGEKPDKDLDKIRTSEGITAKNITWTGDFDSKGNFIKGNTYSVTVVLDNDPATNGGYSFYGTPANAFSVKNYPYPLAIAKNLTDQNVITIQFPISSEALILTAPVFPFVVADGNLIEPRSITIENNTASTYVVDDIIVSGNEFLLTSEGTDSIKAVQTIDDWKVMPLPGLSKGKHTATITLYYHIAGSETVLYTSVTVSLNVYGVGIDATEVAELNAFGLNGVLTVKGLVAGEPFSVHNAQGVLIYRGVAKAGEATVNVPVKGVYVVTSSGKTLKVINK
ncbi:MAG: hypothetical protein LBH19_03150 [Dysgonamonadaceae bacterium]|jgi:hypothetical protein|nr:hypothetical protein [Dysgonamonadaceae bacterium]